MFILLTVLSAISFTGFGLGYLLSPSMRREFERYGLGRYRVPIAWLQLAGAAGQWAGLLYPPLGGFAAAGLMLMMGCAVITRLRIGDPLWRSLPAGIYLLANLDLLYASLHR